MLPCEARAAGLWSHFEDGGFEDQAKAEQDSMQQAEPEGW